MKLHIIDKPKVRISNEKLWEHAENGCDPDTWLLENVGMGNWTEWLGVVNLPYRSFSFKNEQDAIMFALKWS